MGLDLSIVGTTADISFGIPGSGPVRFLEGLDIASVSFLDVRLDDVASPGSGLAWSGVTSGEIRIPQVAGQIDLEVGDWVQIEGSPLRITSLDLTDAGLAMTIQGQATTLEVGTAGHRRTLKPTLMRIAITNQTPWLAFWGVIGAIILLLPKATGLISGRWD